MAVINGSDGGGSGGDDDGGCVILCRRMDGKRTPEPVFKNPRVGNLFTKWRQVWLKAMDRRRKLQDALDHLNEVDFCLSVCLSVIWLHCCDDEHSSSVFIYYISGAVTLTLYEKCPVMMATTIWPEKEMYGWNER